MFKNYVTIAVRNLLKYKGYSVINILGLAIGMACCVLIFLFVQDELDYDRYHEKSDRIYRITESGVIAGKAIEVALTPPLWGPTLTRDYPEVVNWVRILPPRSRWLVRYEDVRFYEKGFFHADSTVFEVFSFPLVQGNPKTALAGPNRAVVSESMAAKYFGDAADYDYVDVMGIEVIEGRNFSRAFPTDSTACLINEAAVRSLGWDEPLGKTFTRPGFSPGAPPIKVIGVMRDFHNRSLHQPIEPFILFFSGPQAPYAMVIKIRGADIPRALGILQDQWNATFPSHPPMEYSFLDEDFEKQYLAEQRLGSVFIAVANLSIFIACLGLFGLASFMAEQRTREIGVRKVLGATVTDIVVLLSKDFTKLVAIAFVIGAPVIYYVMNGWLQEFPYRIEMSMWLFIAAGLAAFVIAGATVGYQAVKAAWTNPTDALQYE